MPKAWLADMFLLACALALAAPLEALLPDVLLELELPELLELLESELELEVLEPRASLSSRLGSGFADAASEASPSLPASSIAGCSSTVSRSGKSSSNASWLGAARARLSRGARFLGKTRQPTRLGPAEKQCRPLFLGLEV